MTFKAENHVSTQQNCVTYEIIEQLYRLMVLLTGS